MDRACEAGLALLPGNNGAAWERGRQRGRTLPAAAPLLFSCCSTPAAPLQPAWQSPCSAELLPPLPLPSEHLPSGLAPTPPIQIPVWPMLLRSIKLVCLMYFLLKSVQMAALLSLAAGLGSYKITCM